MNASSHPREARSDGRCERGEPCDSHPQRTPLSVGATGIHSGVAHERAANPTPSASKATAGARANYPCAVAVPIRWRPMTTAIRAFFLALATGAAIGQAPTHVPADAFDVPDGLEVTVWAKAPLLQNPTNMDVDHLGRIWITEGVNYRGKAKRRPEGDRVVVLEDKDGDGVAETSTVFVQEPSLVSPLGVAVFDNVVVVSQPPECRLHRRRPRPEVRPRGQPLVRRRASGPQPRPACTR